jgi:ABC-type multidrug transport system, ATPase component
MSRIEIKNLTKSFGSVTALKDITLSFESGHVYGLLGRNGAGKTTLLNLVTGKLFPDGGEITMDGEPALENDRALSKIYCMTEMNLYPERMRVREALRWSATFYPHFDTDYAKGLCEKFELNPNKRIRELSTGYASIFKIVIALACGSEIAIFDEPVLGLDANHRELFYRELIENFSDSQRAVVLSTHLIEEAAPLVDRVVILKTGEVILDDEVQNVLALGYTVSGPAGAVDDYGRGRQSLGSDTLGGLKSAYFMGECGEVPAGLEKSKLDLQKLFIQLTNS